ncbi:MAG: hypothetical protein HYW89_02605 [Candidatus Sungiibacteriota bacterium]|uniref:R3H domain-containing protein n=1 Tax=Candidatus Sungiibacteriota bacterium TaxID=2750080 RepID=A0A7T5UQ72_9BACT|nr:MAG: hypothetical protein HYW89_02605 [Candidatus Sungbacteria bacterium]
MEQERIKEEIRSMFTHMGFEEDIEDIEAHQGTTSRFSIRVRQDSSMLIGERGVNLVAIDHLLKKIIRKKYGEEQKFTLDINDYRIKKLEDLKQDVKNAAREVRLYHREVPLHPMSSFERRIVHLLLAEYPDITTESIGQEPARRVIIKPYP